MFDNRNMAKQDEYIRITTRIPPELRDALVKLANRTERSLNGELVARLQFAVAIAEAEARPELKVEQIQGNYSVTASVDALIDIIKSMPEEKQKALLKILT
jgi:hypothetical protein